MFACAQMCPAHLSLHELLRFPSILLFAHQPKG